MKKQHIIIALSLFVSGSQAQISLQQYLEVTTPSFKYSQVQANLSLLDEKYPELELFKDTTMLERIYCWYQLPGGRIYNKPEELVNAMKKQVCGFDTTIYKSDKITMSDSLRNQIMRANQYVLRSQKLERFGRVLFISGSIIGCGGLVWTFVDMMNSKVKGSTGGLACLVVGASITLTGVPFNLKSRVLRTDGNIDFLNAFHVHNGMQVEKYTKLNKH